MQNVICISLVNADADATQFALLIYAFCLQHVVTYESLEVIMEEVGIVDFMNELEMQVNVKGKPCNVSFIVFVDWKCLHFNKKITKFPIIAQKPEKYVFAF